MVGLTPSLLLSGFFSPRSSLLKVELDGGVEPTRGLESGAGGDGLGSPVDFSPGFS